MSRSGSKAGWCKLPLEPAPAWFKLSLFARALGSELFRVYQESVVELSLEDAEDVLVRMLGPEPDERKATRHALRAMVSSGLIVAVEGGIRVLYSRESYAAHHRPKVDGRSAKVPGRYPDGTPMVPGPSPDGLQTVGAKPADSLDADTQREREKERKKEGERASAPPQLSGAHTQTVRDLVAAEALAQGWRTAPELLHTQLRLVAERCARYAQESGKPFAEAALELVRAGLEKARAHRQGPGFALLEAEPGQTYEPRQEARQGGARRTAESVRKEAQAAVLGGDWDAVKRLNGEVRELEEAEERAARGGRRAAR